MSRINHTLVLCAYKESEFLEECLMSLLNQTVKADIVISTSTPNDYINGIASKYNIKVFLVFFFFHSVFPIPFYIN